MTTTSKSTRSIRVFISSAVNDADQTRILRRLLEQHSEAVIFSADSLSAGEDWQTRLRDELTHSDVFFVLVSSHTTQSSSVLSELGGALALRKPVITVTDPNTYYRLPIEYRDIQSVSLEELEKPEVLNRPLAPFQNREKVKGESSL